MPVTRDLHQDDPLAGRLSDGLPTIDASLLLDDSSAAIDVAVQAISAACRQTGFFYVSSAFGSDGADKRVLSQMQSFFELPDDDPCKQAVSSDLSCNDLGWTPVGGEAAYQPGTNAYVESFDFGRIDNDENLWPEIAGFKDDVKAYWSAVSAIGYAILERLALAIDLDRSFFFERCRTGELNTLRLLHYPANDIVGDDKNVGISAHTDFECLTLLYQTAPGLELTNVEGRWYDTPATDDGLFVFIDDMLELWTNGYLKATGHRVRHTNQQRFSIVLFMAVDSGITVEPLPQFNRVSETGTYTPVTQETHIDAEMKRARANSEST